MNWFEPFLEEFMQAAMLSGCLIAVMCAMLSCFLILRGWSLMGDAISHAVLPGIVLAYWIGIPLLIGAFFSGLFCALSTGFIKNHSRIKEDTVMGVVFTGLFAVGLVMFTRTTSDIHLDHILFGNILGISNRQVGEIAAVALVVSAVVWLKRRDFLLLSFDPSQARVIHLPVRFLHYALLCLLTLAIVISLHAVGIILVTALLISPGATAFLWTKRFDRMMAIACATALFSTITGILISYHFDLRSGPCIVLVQALLFVLSMVLGPRWLKKMGRLQENRKKIKAS